MREVTLTSLPEWEALRASTGALYEAFSSYLLRDNIPYCTHCVTEARHVRLRAKPLRELSDGDLTVVLYNPGTWGDEADVKHFLPRLFELVSLGIAGQPTGLESERLGNRVKSEGNGFASWPASERAALTSFCLAWWRAMLTTNPSMPFILDETAEAVLCSIAQFTDDLAPYLTAWERAMDTSESLAPVAHLLVFLCRYVIPPPWLTHNEPDAWWGHIRPQWQQVRTWLQAPETASIAERALRRARERGEAIDPLWFDSDEPEDIAPALAWIASCTEAG